MEKYSEKDSKYQDFKENHEKKLQSRYEKHLNKPNEYNTPINTLRYDFKAMINNEKNELINFYLDSGRCYENKIKHLTLFRFQNGKLGRYPFNPVKAFFECVWDDLMKETLSKFMDKPIPLEVWEKEEIDFANSNNDDVIDFLAVQTAFEDFISIIEKEIEEYNMIQNPQGLKGFSDFKNYFKEFDHIDNFLCDLKELFKEDFKEDGVKAFYISYLLFDFNLFNFNFLPEKIYDFKYKKTNFTKVSNAFFLGDEDYWPSSTLLANYKFDKIEDYKVYPRLKESRENLLKLIEKYQP